MRIEKLDAWRTSDGVVHASLELANKHVQFQALVKKLSKDLDLRDVNVDAEEVIRWVNINKIAILALLA